jgi:uncharacterized protein YdeI (YjbR/CyaY-like superfamily)
MGKKDKRIDTYIAKARPFAKPILNHLRELVHQACPEVEETIKWSFASFDYKGPFCSMASFNEHAVFGFWKGALIKDKGNYLQPHKTGGGDAMGNLGRITSLKDLPPDKVILDFIKQAKKLNDDGVKLPLRPKMARKELKTPEDMLSALKKNKKALSSFGDFSPSHKREYIEWITEARTEATRKKRLDQAIAWMAEGKPRNWKYMRK